MNFFEKLKFWRPKLQNVKIKLKQIIEKFRPENMDKNEQILLLFSNSLYDFQKLKKLLHKL